jgi:hypothetical protein
MYASACFYKHFSLDWSQLVKNLGGNVELAGLTLRQFMYAAAMSTPSGKQKSFAAFNPPEGILVEVKTAHCTPISYANAFADPVPLKSTRGLIGESIARLGHHVHEIADGYDIKADRFWFSPSGRHSLTWVDRDAKAPEAVKPTVTPEGHNVKSLDELVSKVMKAVKDAGKASPEEA